MPIKHCIILLTILIGGCSYDGNTSATNMRHWHGKNYHKIAPDNQVQDTKKGHWHGKNYHKVVD